MTTTTVLFNDIFEYQPHPYMKMYVTRCHLLILQRDTEFIVIATELRDNPGKSITNSSEALATEVVKRFKLNPESCVFLEHYSDITSYGDASGMSGFDPDHYSQVVYAWNYDAKLDRAKSLVTWCEMDMINTSPDGRYLSPVASLPKWQHISYETVLSYMGILVTPENIQGLSETDYEFIGILDYDKNDAVTAYKQRWEALPLNVPSELFTTQTVLHYERTLFVWGVSRNLKRDMVVATLAMGHVKHIRFYAVSKEFEKSL
jgi:hypothetical protein